MCVPNHYPEVVQRLVTARVHAAVILIVDNVRSVVEASLRALSDERLNDAHIIQKQ